MSHRAATSLLADPTAPLLSEAPADSLAFRANLLALHAALAAHAGDDDDAASIAERADGIVERCGELAREARAELDGMIRRARAAGLHAGPDRAWLDQADRLAWRLAVIASEAADAAAVLEARAPGSGSRAARSLGEAERQIAGLTRALARAGARAEAQAAAGRRVGAPDRD